MGAAAQAPAPVTSRANDSKASLPYGLVRSRRLPEGIPLGSLGSGGFRLFTDGTIGSVAAQNNWLSPSGDLRGCFAAIWSSAGGRVSSRVLSLSPAFGLPGVAAVDALPRCSQAFLDYADPSLSVRLSLHAFSPLVPGDLRNSSLPAALLAFRVCNISRGPVDVSIALSWEALGGVGAGPEGPFADRTGNAIQPVSVENGSVGLSMAPGELPISGPVNRFRYNARGGWALLAEPRGTVSQVTTATWNALESPKWWPRFARDGSVDGQVGPGKEGAVHPAGVVAVRLTLADGETQDVPFVVAWYAQRLYVREGTEYGHFYEKTFDDAVGVARYALADRLALGCLTDEWQNLILRSTLPPWMAYRMVNDVAPMVTRSILTRDDGSGDSHPGPWRFAMLSGSPSGSLGDLGGIPVAALTEGAFFPGLFERELSSYASLQSASGALPAGYGNLFTGFSQAEDSTDHTSAADAAAYAYGVVRAVRTAGDKRLLMELYPSVKHLIDGGAVTAPVSVRDRAQWLAVLRIAGEAGRLIADRPFVDRCAVDAAKAASELTTVVSLGRGPTELLANATAVLEAQGLADGCGAGTAMLPPDMLRQCAERVSVSDSPVPWPAVAALVAHGKPDAALTLWERDSATSPGTWGVADALNGLDLSLLDGTLALRPVVRGAAQFVMPVFAPTFWGRLEARSSAGQTSVAVRIERMLPISEPADRKLHRSSGLVLRSVALPDAARSARMVTVTVSRTPVPGKLQVAGDVPVYVFDAPVSLAVGARLEVQLW